MARLKFHLRGVKNDARPGDQATLAAQALVFTDSDRTRAPGEHEAIAETATPSTI